MKLNVGAIGDGPRTLICHPTESRKSYTIIDIPVKKSKSFSYKTYTPGNGIIKLSSLPDSVLGFN